MTVVIRKIRLEDAEGYYAALSAVAKERIYNITVTPRPFEEMRRFVESCIDNDHAFYVAEDGGRIVGWIDIVPHARETLRHTGAIGMSLLSEYRGQGVGQQLLERALEHAWSKGLTRIELEVFSDNEPARRLYRKFGFEEEGVKKYGRYMDGKYQDLVIMAQYRIQEG